MEFEDLNILLKKYFAGESSLDEELQIKRFFNEQSGLSEELKQTKAMFDFFQKESGNKMEAEIILTKETKKSEAGKVKKLFYIITSIAASILLYISIINYVDKPEKQIIYAYVNGLPVMDKNQAKLEMEKALLLVSENLNQGTKNLQHLSTFSKAEDIVTQNE